MAQVTFHSNRGEKSALVLLKPNAFQFASVPVYLARKPFEGATAGQVFDIPEGYRIIDLVDIETGEARKTETGENLKTLVW